VQVTGACEGWLRAECALAASRGYFGPFTELYAERGRHDLVLTSRGRTRRVEFKFVFNNKNLFGGYNGTRGLAKDVHALEAADDDEKYVAAFLTFFDRGSFLRLPNAYVARNRGTGERLQPSDGEAFAGFAAQLARKVTSEVVATPAEVSVLGAGQGFWLGLWLQRIS
jgi:hypothetical protein